MKPFYMPLNRKQLLVKTHKGQAARVIRKIVACGVIAMTTILNSHDLFAELPTAKQVASQMKTGVNLGNTLEAIGGETAWGAAKTTQALIDSIKAAGFNTIRIPVAWFTHSDTINSEIDEAWMARVKEVVDYCINDEIFVIINMHWDKGWLETRVNKANQSLVNERLYSYWSQIAGYFIDYDEHLLFAGANEPNVNDATGMEVLLSYHQTFIDAVRETGGNNASRTLIIQGPSTDIEKTNKLMNKLPVDAIENRLIVEVHYYTPYQFCLMNEDANWGKMFYYWGKDYHSKTDTQRNSTWGEEQELDRLFELMKTKFVDKGIPVIIGEFGAYKRKLSAPSDQELHNKSVEFFNKYVVKSAISKGMIPYYWDTPGGLFNRQNGTINDKGLHNSLMEGAREATSTQSYVPKNSKEVDIYPNPFFSVFYVKINRPNEANVVKIFNRKGQLVEALNVNKSHDLVALGAGLKPEMYMVQVSGNTKTESTVSSYKILKLE